jgi:hypothetical protein
LGVNETKNIDVPNDIHALQIDSMNGILFQCSLGETDFCPSTSWKYIDGHHTLKIKNLSANESNEIKIIQTVGNKTKLFWLIVICTGICLIFWHNYSNQNDRMQDPIRYLFIL